MMKILLTGIVLIGMIVCADAKDYQVGNYRLAAQPNGAFSLYYKNNIVAQSDPFRAHNPQWKCLFGGFVFHPTIKEDVKANKVVISYTASNDAMIDFSEQLTLTDKGMTGIYSGITKKEIFDFGVLLKLASGTYGGQRYQVLQDNGDIKSGVLAQDTPPSKQWDLAQTGNTIEKVMFTTDFGISAFNFMPARVRLIDIRSPKNPFITACVLFSKTPAGTKWRQQFFISIKPASEFSIMKAKSNPISNTSNLRDIALAKPVRRIRLDAKTQNISNLYFVPDDAELIRTINTKDHYRIGLRWNNNRNAPMPKVTSRADSMERVITCNDLQIVETIAYPLQTSALNFNTKVKNLSGQEKSDGLQGSVCIIPGRVENELNPQARVAVRGEDGHFKTLKITDLWGEYQYFGASVLALFDREMKSAWVIAFPQEAPESLTLHVGRQDSHCSRDCGKRTTVEWKFPEFKLKKGETAIFHHDFILFKGLRGIVAIRDSLAVNAQWQTKVVKPGETARCQLEFAAAAPINSTIKVKYLLTSENDRMLASGSKTFPAKLNTAQATGGELAFSLPAGTSECTCKLEFSDAQGPIGQTTLKLSTTGTTVAEFRQQINTMRRELNSIMEAIPFPGAETPATLTAYAKAEYHLQQAEDHLRFDELAATAKALQEAQNNRRKMTAAVAIEKAQPVTGRLRSMMDIKTAPRMYAVGNKLYSPEGIRFFLQGMCDTDQFCKVRRMFARVVDPLGKLDPKKPALENLRDPRLRRLLINALVHTIRQYGNSHSQYVETKNLDKPEYCNFMLELLTELKNQGIWTTVFIGAEGWNIYSEPEKFVQYQQAVRDFTIRFMNMPNLTHTVVVSPEPIVQRPNTNPNHWKEFRDWYARRYHAPNRLKLLGYDNDAKLATDLLSENIYSPVTADYVDFLGEIICNATESMIKLYREIGLKNNLYLGYSIWCRWPLTLVNVFQRFAANPNIEGYCLDLYLGGWWGAEANPPELGWTGDLQYSSYKPLIIGEWGSGASMPNSSPWKYALSSLRQSFGRNYFARGVSGMYAWSSAWSGWNNMFEFNGTPLPVTRHFCGRRDAIISSPLAHENSVLSLAAIKGMPRYIAIAQIRLAASAPLIGTTLDTGNIDDLKVMGPEHYRLFVVHTEGISADKLAALRQLKKPVLLLGRPASVPDKSGMSDWIKQKLFIKDPAARYSGGGAPRSLSLKFIRNLGELHTGMTLPHYFAANRSAWVKPEQLCDDVEIIAMAGKYAILMRQGNLYWFTDMLGIESVDMPADRAPIYPSLQPSELQVLANMLRQAGISCSDDPVSVRVVNDAAVLYDARTGHVEFYHANAFKLPDGMFPRAYELFSDGVVLLVGGERLHEHNQIMIRCKAAKISSVTIDGMKVDFKRLNERQISIDYTGKGWAICDIRVYY